MAEYYLLHSILKIQETEDLRNVRGQTAEQATILEFTYHRSTIIGHGTEPGKCLFTVTTISSNNELDDCKSVCMDDHKIVCLFCV